MTGTLSNKDSHDANTVALPAQTPTAPTDVRIQFAGRTDVGSVRPNNEDQYLIARLRKSVDVLAASLPAEQDAHPFQREGYLFLVADGMGGAAAGEVASAIVVREAITHVVETAKWFFRLDDPDEHVRLRLLREALERVDRRLVEEGEKNPKLAGMGTTLTAASVLGSEAFIVHVGDSRAYLFHDGQLEQLTRDHTIGQELVRRGLMQPDEARTYRLRHVLTNVLGGKPGVEGEVVKVLLGDGDRLLLCTDGLSGPVTDGQMAEILSRCADPEAACDALIAAAAASGGRDNVTAVVVAFSI